MDSWDAIVDRNDIDTLANILEYHSIREHEEQEVEEQKLKVLMAVLGVRS